MAQKRLDAEIDAEADDPASLSPTDRETRESEVLSDMLAVERDESWFVWQAMAQRLPVEHRSDIDPVALLLGVRLVTAPATIPSPGTSMGMSFKVRR